MKVIDVLTICFKLILFKKTLEEKRLEETDELDENDDDAADEQEQDIWRKKKQWQLCFLLTATVMSTLTWLW